MVQIIKRRVSSVALLVGLAHASLCRAGAAPVTPEQAARAEQFFHDGTQAFEAARYPEAYKALRAAWELSPNYRTAAGLGQVELELAQYRDAASHLAYCLRHYPDGADPAARSHVEEGLEQARAYVAAVRIRVSVEGAEVAIDGTPVGRSPLDGLVFLDEGMHVVGASRPGYRPAEQNIETPVRAVRDVSLSLTPEPAGGGESAVSPSSAAAPPAAESPRPSEGPLLSPTAWVILVGGSLTAAALATTIVFELKGSSASDDLREAQRQVGSGPQSSSSCQGADTPACNRVRDLADQRNTDNQIATLSAIITGALAVATAGTAWYVNAHQRPPAAASRPFVRFSASHTGGGFVFGTAF